MLSKIKQSILADLKNNKLTLVTTFAANTFFLLENPRDDLVFEILFWLSVLIQASLALYLLVALLLKINKKI